MNNKRTNSFAPIPLPEALRLFVLCLAAGGCLPLVRAEEPKGPGTKKAGVSRKATWSSQEEWNRDKPTVAWVFPFIDKNSDGKIDADEYQAIQEYKKKHRDWQAQTRKELGLAARNLLLGEAPGAVVGPDRRAGKRGLIGNRAYDVNPVCKR